MVEAVTSHAGRCAVKLRKQNSYAKELLVFISTNRFSDHPQYANSKKIIFPTATNSNLELIRYPKIGMESIFIPGYLYKNAGVIVSNIMPADNVQLNLLDTTDHAG